MRKKALLNQDQRNFFSLVVKSIYMNAFLDERQEIGCVTEALGMRSEAFLISRGIPPHGQDVFHADVPIAV